MVGGVKCAVIGWRIKKPQESVMSHSSESTSKRAKKRCRFDSALNRLWCHSTHKQTVQHIHVTVPSFHKPIRFWLLEPKSRIRRKWNTFEFLFYCVSFGTRLVTGSGLQQQEKWFILKRTNKPFTSPVHVKFYVMKNSTKNKFYIFNLNLNCRSAVQKGRRG